MEPKRPCIACARTGSRPYGPQRGPSWARTARRLQETAPVIRTHHRLKGGTAQLGATGTELPGPFGIRPADDHQEHEPATGGHSHAHLNR